MHIKHKFRKGDISLLVTVLVCSIILILLVPLAQKVSVEAKISRENLLSQQAVQAATTGLDAWKSNFINGSSNPVSDTSWTQLDTTLGIEYRVDFYPKSDTKPAYIVSRGRSSGSSGVSLERTIERSLEETFNPITTTAP